MVKPTHIDAFQALKRLTLYSTGRLFPFFLETNAQNEQNDSRLEQA